MDSLKKLWGDFMGEMWNEKRQEMFVLLVRTFEELAKMSDNKVDDYLVDLVKKALEMDE